MPVEQVPGLICIRFQCFFSVLVFSLLFLFVCATVHCPLCVKTLEWTTSISHQLSENRKRIQNSLALLVCCAVVVSASLIFQRNRKYTLWQQKVKLTEMGIGASYNVADLHSWCTSLAHLKKVFDIFAVLFFVLLLCCLSLSLLCDDNDDAPAFLAFFILYSLARAEQKSDDELNAAKKKKMKSSHFQHLQMPKTCSSVLNRHFACFGWLWLFSFFIKVH